jgi:hypothetical protein
MRLKIAVRSVTGVSEGTMTRLKIQQEKSTVSWKR